VKTNLGREEDSDVQTSTADTGGEAGLKDKGKDFFKLFFLE
jgi:hypothetical protein